jgi:hypothetical protein
MLAHAQTPGETLGELLFAAAGALAWVAFWRLRGNGFLWLPRPAGWALAVLALASVAGAVVIPSVTAPSYAKIRPHSTATVDVLAPTRNETVRGDRMEVDVRLIGGRVTAVTTTSVRPDVGHIHVSIDGQLLTMSTATRSEVDISALSNGEHLLQAEFVAADHGPFDPPVVASVPFRKEG